MTGKMQLTREVMFHRGHLTGALPQVLGSLEVTTPATVAPPPQRYSCVCAHLRHSPGRAGTCRPLHITCAVSGAQASGALCPPWQWFIECPYSPLLQLLHRQAWGRPGWGGRGWCSSGLPQMPGRAQPSPQQRLLAQWPGLGRLHVPLAMAPPYRVIPACCGRGGGGHQVKGRAWPAERC